MTTLTTVKLNELIPDAGINTRVTARSAEIEAMAANIRHLGLLLPLSVRKSDKGYAIIDGHRRHAALLLVHTDQSIDIPVLVQEATDSQAHTMSLSANIMRVPLHPVDQYRAFARLVDDGATVEDVARTFGVTTKLVKQRMALGDVIGPVMDAYLDEKIDLELVKLFAGESKQKQQSLWDQVMDDNLHRWQINQLFSDATFDKSDPITEFVGREAYVAAGGQITEDLFGEQGEKWTDVPLAQRLAKERMAEVKHMMLDSGWMFVVTEDESPFSRWQYQRLFGVPHFPTPEKAARHKELMERSDNEELEGDDYEEVRDEIEALEAEMTYTYPPNIKKISGVFITKDYEPIYGMMPPEKKSEKEATKKAEAKEANGNVSQALADDLGSCLTMAVQDSIGTEGGLAIPLLVLTLVEDFERGWTSIDGPLSLSSNTKFKHEANPYDEVVRKALDLALLPEGSFMERLRLVSHPDWRPHLLRLLEVLAARLLNKQTFTSPLLEFVTGEGGFAHDQLRFFEPFRQNFFERISTEQIMGALADAKVAKPPKGMKKKELVSYAVRLTAEAGWMPEVLAWRKPKAKPKKKAA